MTFKRTLIQRKLDDSRGNYVKIWLFFPVLTSDILHYVFAVYGEKTCTPGESGELVHEFQTCSVQVMSPWEVVRRKWPVSYVRVAKCF